jgi:hypothetical protein
MAVNPLRERGETENLGAFAMNIFPLRGIVTQNLHLAESPEWQAA